MCECENGLKNHMPLFSEFRRTSQANFHMDSVPTFARDVCQNSRKSGIWHFWPELVGNWLDKWLWSMKIEAKRCLKGVPADPEPKKA